jgi:hypothetical protein
VSLNIWAKFLEVANASIKGDASHRIFESYGKADHEIHYFVEPFTRATAEAITSLPDVKRHIEAGIFGKKPVYVVSGLRIAKKSFTVKKEVGGSVSGKVTGSTPSVPGPVPVGAGASLGGSSGRKVTDSYDTASEIVFAYRVHVLRTKRAGVEVELFSDKSAFLTGSGTDEEEPIVVVEGTKEEVEGDLEEQVSFEISEVGEDEYCISF